MENTNDLSKFGYREIGIAGELLIAYSDQKWADKGNDHLEEGLKLEFNPYSGEVFLIDEDYNVAMLNDDGYLENFLHCNWCAKEGLRSEMNLDNDGNCEGCHKSNQ